MPFISEAASAIKSRFRFHDRTSATESVPATPDLLKSVSRDNIPSSLSLVPTSAIRSIEEWEDDATPASSESVAPQQTGSFEFNEDPSFWKDHNVQVIIRIRPLSSSEISLQGYSKCVRQESCQTVTWTGHPESRFTFDFVADESVSQEKLFKVAGVPMVENCVEGYNSCMFAYGQTGSGKTHTMLGDIEGGTRRHSVNCGMTPRVFEYLFSRIQKEKEARKDEKLKFTCKCSFLEIYNEQILDLLDPSSNNLQIREDVKKGIYVENLKEIEVTTARDVIQQLIQGAANRKVAVTNMNCASSRSHSVFTCVIESKWENQGVTHHRFARLNLVDLAGSERQKSSGAEGERLKEATNINKSLSTLGLVIMNLVSISNGKSLHVPYRDSKLTFLLQDSLGGNSKTIIIANISPSLCNSLETLSTLKFAQRAKFIKNNAIVNEDASGDIIAMRGQIQQLKKEVSRLRSLVNGAGENLEAVDSSGLSFLGSPGSFKWDGLHGSYSPLLSEKRMSQKKDYEVALVGAFRREKDKDIALKALTAETQAAMQLAKQREDEIQSLKMRLRFREAGIKRLEAIASGKISAETHLLKEKEEQLKEIEVLRTQVDRNQEVTRFAMENLQLKEEIRRLKSFYEEGEREMMNEQIAVLQNKLLEALDWKLMHESDSLGVQKAITDAETEAEGSTLISNQETGSPWHTTIKEENEFLRMQAIQNQAEIDALHKQLDFCLQEKDKLERHVIDLEKKLEEASSLKAAKEGKHQIEFPPLPADTSLLNINDPMELQTMVDAIASASEREAEAHEKAITLSKENKELWLKLQAYTDANSELESKLKGLIDEKNSLIEMYERAASECNYKNNISESTRQNGMEVCNDSGSGEFAEVKQIEMETVVKNLEQQLLEMHEENEKLMGLYEKAMHERDDFKRLLSSGWNGVEPRGEVDCPEKLVEVDEGESLEPCIPPMYVDAKYSLHETSHPVSDVEDTGKEAKLEGSSISGEETSRQNPRENLIDPHINDFPTLPEPPNHVEENTSTETTCLSATANEANMDIESNTSMEIGTHSYMEIESSNLHVVKALRDLDSVRMKLETAQEKLSDSNKIVTALVLLEKAFIEFDKLSKDIEANKEGLKVRQQEFRSLEHLSLEMQERKTCMEKKLSALRYSLSSFSSSVVYFEQREARARARVNASKSFLDQKKEELTLLHAHKAKVDSALGRNRQSELELRNNLAVLKSKLEEENRKHEKEKVLFAIDNIGNADVQTNLQLGGKATELLKSEEEKTKLQTEIKLCRERLGLLRREFEDLNKKLWKVESDIQPVQMDIQKRSRTVEETEAALQGVVQEMETLLEVRNNGWSEIQNMILEYQQHVFDIDLKEAEIKILGEKLQLDLQRVEELRTRRVSAAGKMAKLLEETGCQSCFLSEKMEEELQSACASVREAQTLLEGNAIPR